MLPDTVAVDDKEKIKGIIKKRNPQAYAKCIEKKCGSFFMMDVGSGTVMYHCPIHNFNGTAVV